MNIRQLNIIAAQLGFIELFNKTDLPNIFKKPVTLSNVQQQVNIAVDVYADALNKEGLDETEIMHKVNYVRLKKGALLKLLLQNDPQALEELITTQALPQEHKAIFPDIKELFLLYRSKKHLFFITDKEFVKIVTSGLTPIEIFEKFSSAYYHYLGHNKDAIKDKFYKHNCTDNFYLRENMQEMLIGYLGFCLQSFFAHLFEFDNQAKQELTGIGMLAEDGWFCGDCTKGLPKHKNPHYDIIKKIVCD